MFFVDVDEGRTQLIAEFDGAFIFTALFTFFNIKQIKHKAPAEGFC